MQFVLQEIEKEIGYTFPKNAVLQAGDTFCAEKKDGRLFVSYASPRHIMRAALIAKARADERTFTVRDAGSFLDTVAMIDCSRNAVPTVDTVKKFVRNAALTGYNAVMLYTEDTFEVNGEPIVGYMRGRYSKAELKELNAYADALGIELIPCVQTLAHLNQIVRYAEYEAHFDCGDILLAGDRRVYTLIENIFSTLAECFTSRRAHIGMDEASLLGCGAYRNTHGVRPKFEIFTEHLAAVARIAEKYGFTVMMWSDMFWKIAKEECRDSSKGLPDIPPRVVAAVPPSVSLVHWEYDSYRHDEYDWRFAVHKPFSDVWGAAASYKQMGFLPQNAYSFAEFELFFPACKQNGLRRVINCFWADDGAEASLFSALPGLVRFASLSRGDGVSATEKEFFALTGYRLSDFMKVEYPNTGCGKYTDDANPTKIALYNDVFCPYFDTEWGEGAADEMRKAVDEIRTVPQGQYAYLFFAAGALGKAAGEKLACGLALRKAYTDGDRDALLRAADELHTCAQNVRVFLEALRAQWFTENKPYGFDVQEYRLGGLIERLYSCERRLRAYSAGEVEEIPELAERLIPDLFLGEQSPGRFHYNSFILTASAGRF